MAWPLCSSEADGAKLCHTSTIVARYLRLIGDGISQTSLGNLLPA